MDHSGYFLWAVALGGLSAVSLPLGSALGLATRPGARTISWLAAFGAGALLAALSVELVAPTVAELSDGEVPRPLAVAHLAAMVFGALAGGALFVALDQLVNERGGFLRKTATSVAWFRERRAERDRRVLEELCGVELLRALPPEQVGLLVRDVNRLDFGDGEMLFREGQTGHRLFFIRKGSIQLERGGEPFRTLGRGDVVGELALLTRAPRAATARAQGDVSTFVLHSSDFERWRQLCPELDAGVRALAAARLDELREESQRDRVAEQQWSEQAVAALRSGTDVPTPAEMRAAAAEHSGAPLAVWLGILLDGIPESFVIGAGFLGLLSGRLAGGGEVAFADVVPYTLIAGLALSNFPEAMSSSVGMRAHGWSGPRILWMWTALMLMTAAGAGGGYLLGEVLGHELLIAAEGVAAGAMLTMLVSTMIPEAVMLGGRNLVGVSTLVGFLSAVCFKLLE